MGKYPHGAAEIPPHSHADRYRHPQRQAAREALQTRRRKSAVSAGDAGRRKLWRFKYRVGGAEKLLALGAYPDVTLVRPARSATRPVGCWLTVSIRRRSGRPRSWRTADTFKAVAEEFLTQREKAWAPTHASKVRARLEWLYRTSRQAHRDNRGARAAGAGADDRGMRQGRDGKAHPAERRTSVSVRGGDWPCQA